MPLTRLKNEKVDRPSTQCSDGDDRAITMRQTRPNASWIQTGVKRSPYSHIECLDRMASRLGRPFSGTNVDCAHGARRAIWMPPEGDIQLFAKETGHG